MLRLIRAAELPAPRVNARLGGYEVDFLWREEQLVVEVDGSLSIRPRRWWRDSRPRWPPVGSQRFSRSTSASDTGPGTRSETSPPNVAISFTPVEERKL
jgi:hypothetical protein